jgi:hypothetical protein
MAIDDRPDPEADHVPSGGGFFSCFALSVVSLLLYVALYYLAC